MKCVYVRAQWIYPYIQLELLAHVHDGTTVVHLIGGSCGALCALHPPAREILAVGVELGVKASNLLPQFAVVLAQQLRRRGGV